MAKEGPKESRRAARRELDRGRLKLLTVGGYVAQAVETHSRSWFSLARAFVDPRSSATDLLKNGVAASIQCLKAGEDVAFGIRVTRPVNPSSSAYFSGLIFPDCPYPHILPDKNHLVAVPQQPDLIPGPDLQPFQLRVFPRPAAERIQNSHVFPICKNHETLLCVP